jgi:hypothetical protein
MDYVTNGLTYDAAQSGLFMGVGVKILKKRPCQKQPGAKSPTTRDLASPD